MLICWVHCTIAKWVNQRLSFSLNCWVFHSTSESFTQLLSQPFYCWFCQSNAESNAQLLSESLKCWVSNWIAENSQHDNKLWNIIKFLKVQIVWKILKRSVAASLIDIFHPKVLGGKRCHASYIRGTYGRHENVNLHISDMRKSLVIWNVDFFPNWPSSYLVSNDKIQFKNQFGKFFGWIYEGSKAIWKGFETIVEYSTSILEGFDIFFYLV